MEQALSEATRNLTAMTHAHVIEMVQQKLHSSRQKYIDHLSYTQVDDKTWLIELEPQAFFIEEGLPANFDMIEGLLGQGRPDKSRPEGIAKGKVKTAKDGSRYRVIPFQHNKGPSSQTPAQNSLADTIKAEMKSRKMSWGGLEKDADGKPKQGFIGGFDIKNKPLRTSTTGPGQGHGPIGLVRQGPSAIPHLQGVRVYQKEVARTDRKTGIKSSKTEKFIMTFRVVSSKMQGIDRWVHPGLEARRFFDEAYEWALKQFEEQIVPKLMQDFRSKI